MIVYPNAKINLGLHITQKRPDGFHEIETVMFPTKLCDALEVVPADTSRSSFSLSGMAVPDHNQNLCVSACKLLQQSWHLPPVRIFLHKKIPIGAGLGGGSADAAFTLKALKEMYNLQVPSSTLHELASSLGSDCPFFLENKPMLASGRGEILNPLPEIDLSGWHLIVITPPVHVPTAAAYQGVIPKKPAQPLLEVIQQPVHLWKHSLINDFEETIFRKFPAIAPIKEKLYQLGATYASMSGSGSSVFGLFEQKPDEGFRLQFKDHFIWQEEL
ncbi:MAG: 4-(cytidine 5'-diphospho)-2-C-methyl-D-erythritol kinase [Bacteroidales bacterium]